MCHGTVEALRLIQGQGGSRGSVGRGDGCLVGRPVRSAGLDRPVPSTENTEKGVVLWNPTLPRQDHRLMSFQSCPTDRVHFITPYYSSLLIRSLHKLKYFLDWLQKRNKKSKISKGEIAASPSLKDFNVSLYSV